MTSEITPTRWQIDLNADLGESFGRWQLGDDEAMLEVVSSANIACGFHAGDPLTLTATCAAAVRHQVALGAHVSYRDLAGFGRRFLAASRAELRADVLYQIGALAAIARAAGGKVTYLKPHGALYNATVHHEEHAAAVVEAVQDYGDDLAILGLPGSKLLQAAQRAGLRTRCEGFADRGYRNDGTLVPRTEPGAVLHDTQEVTQRVVDLATRQRLRAVDGTELTVKVDSICLHGDTPGAVMLARAVRDGLIGAGVTIAPCGA